MAVFLPQVQPEAPRNALLNLEPINNAIDGYQRNALMQQQMGLQQRQADMQEKRFGMEQERFGLEKQRLADDREKATAGKFGALFQAIDTAPEGQRAAMYQNLRQAMPQFDANLRKYGIDPNNYGVASQFIYRQAGQAGWRMEEQAQRAELRLKNAQAGYYEQRGSGEGASKPPSGYRSTADGNLEPIPGGPADAITGEQAARIGLMANALNYLPDVRGVFLGSESKDQPGQFENPKMGMGTGAHWDFFWNRGDVADAKRKMAIGIEGILRAQTGAAATADEVDRELAKYLPRPEDTPQTRLRKIQLYEDTLRRTIDINTKGTTSSSLRRELSASNAPAGAVQLLQSNPSPEVIQQFEAKYGRGSAAQHLQRR